MSASTPAPAIDRDVVLARILANVKPEEVREKPLAERFAPWRPRFLAYRRKGYSLRQLAEAAAHPDIGIKVTPNTLRKLLRTHQPKNTERDASKTHAKASAGTSGETTQRPA